MRSVLQNARLLASALLLLPTCSTDAPPDPEAAGGDGGGGDDGGCHPILHGRLSSCQTVQIATLSASPRRCVTIASPPPPPPDDGAVFGCDDAPGWHDGTNGCYAYSSVPNFCADYGSIDHGHGPAAGLTADEACCACGGGRRVRPAFRVGEHVGLDVPGPYAGCVLRVAAVEAGGSYKHGRGAGGGPAAAPPARLPFEYALEVTQKCGPEVFRQDPETGVMGLDKSYGPGHRLTTGDEASMTARHRVELRRCRPGFGDQEFSYSVRERRDGHEVAAITHVPTGAGLAVAAGGTGPLFNVTRVFGDGLFLGGDEYVHLRVSGTGARQYYLANGYFGEKEYADVRVFNTKDSMRRAFDEQEFSMWHVRPSVPSEEDSPDGGSGGADEHAAWLVRKMNSMGIDYLERMPPWHLLDVDRDAPKQEVKARFRQISRRFHPDKLTRDDGPAKRESHGRIFVLLQGAYQNLKGADEMEKERYRARADTGSQLFAHSQYVVELLPSHWTRLDGSEGEAEGGMTTSVGGRYVLNTTASLGDGGEGGDSEPSQEPSVQLWVTFMYSGRCGMSRTVVGSVDLAARQLATEGIKVGAYGCGLYPEHSPSPDDPTGVTSDPICAQFRRRETPNVHVVVETVPGRRRRADGTLEEVPLDPVALWENASFRHFYSAAAEGNTTHFYPHNFIGFARAGRRVWEDGHLVHRMGPGDFSSKDFAGNVSVVAFLDGTDGDGGDGEESSSEVVGAVLSSLPGLARRFRSDEVYVGRAWCGYGDEFESVVPEDVDCSSHGVTRLPEIMLYAAGDAVGSSLLRGSFADARDVQIALESAGNVLRMMIGGEDTNDEFDGIDELDDDINGEMDGSCDGMGQQPPPPPEQVLDEIEERMEKDPQLEMPEDYDTVTRPPEEQKLDRPRKPKLADAAGGGKTLSGRETKNRLGGFHQRSTGRRGGGKLLSGGSGGGGGFIAG